MDLSQCLLIAALKGNAESTVQLLRDGANVHVKDGTTTITPLHIACFHGHTDVARILLEHGADVHSTYNYGETPLHLACREGNTDIVKLLLAHGASVKMADKWGNTPLHNCIRNDKPLCALEILKACPDAVNLRDGDGDTPLHDAVRCDFPTCVQILIMNGADANIVNNKGQTPAACAKSREVSFVMETALRKRTNALEKEKKKKEQEEQQKEDSKFKYMLYEVPFSDSGSPLSSHSSIIVDEKEVNKQRNRKSIVVACDPGDGSSDPATNGKEKDGGHRHRSSKSKAHKVSTASASKSKKKKSKKKERRKDTDDDSSDEEYDTVQGLLRELGLEKYYSAFRKQEVKFSSFLLLTEADLCELGLPLGPRRQLMTYIRQRQPALPPLAAGEELRFRREGEGNRILGVYETFDRDGKIFSVKKYVHSPEEIIDYIHEMRALRPELLKTSFTQPDTSPRDKGEPKTILQILTMLDVQRADDFHPPRQDLDQATQASDDERDIYTATDSELLDAYGFRRGGRLADATDDDHSIYGDNYNHNQHHMPGGAGIRGDVEGGAYSSFPLQRMEMDHLRGGGNGPAMGDRTAGAGAMNAGSGGAGGAGHGYAYHSWGSNSTVDRGHGSIFTGIPSHKEGPHFPSSQPGSNNRFCTVS